MGAWDGEVPSEATGRAWGFEFVGNHLCLDFANTEARERGRPVDRLADARALIAWATRAGILDEEGAREAARQWGETADGDALLARARLLRADIRALADGITGGQGVPEEAVDRINAVLRERHGYDQLVRGPHGFERRYHAVVTRPIHLLWPIAEDVADLLCADDPSLVRRCENPSCVLYFYDTTKNHGRRWCSMDTCGNRAKAALHRHRRRATPPSVA